MSLPRVGKSRRLILVLVPSKLPRRHPPPLPAQLWAARSSPLCRKTSSPRCPSPGGCADSCLGSAGRLVRFWPGCSSPTAPNHNPRPAPPPAPRPAPPRIRDAKSTKHRRRSLRWPHACGCRHNPFCKGVAILRQWGVNIVLTFIARLLAHAEPRTCRRRREHPCSRCSGPWRCLNMYWVRGRRCYL